MRQEDDLYDEDEVELLERVPSRFQKIIHKSTVEKIPQPDDYWGWY
jgi:hypothetical protein